MGEQTTMRDHIKIVAMRHRIPNSDSPIPEYINGPKFIVVYFFSSSKFKPSTKFPAK